MQHSITSLCYIALQHCATKRYIHMLPTNTFFCYMTVHHYTTECYATKWVSLPEYSVSGSHAMQTLAPFVEKVLTGQSVHSDAPGWLNVPALQSVHSDVYATPTTQEKLNCCCYRNSETSYEYWLIVFMNLVVWKWKVVARFRLDSYRWGGICMEI